MMVHGGDIYRKKIDIDFSVNINPLGMPERVEEALQKALADCGRYPDIRAEELRYAIEKMNGINKQHVLCGNGASELFLAIVHGIKPKKTMIPVPSFYGYEHAARAAGGEILFYEMKEETGFCLQPDFPEALEEEMDLLFLANPNNPVGNVINTGLLEEILRTCLEKDIAVVMDECFLEFTGDDDERSLKSQLKEYPNLIIVRSFTKIFAMPGVRLGYLFCGNQEMLEQIGNQLPEWNLSVLAQAAGIQACKETEYVKRTAGLVKREREYMRDELEKAGIEVFPSETDYLLIYSSLPLYEKLLEHKILIRDCSNFRGMRKGFYRLAVKSHEENEMLLHAVGKIEEAARVRSKDE